MVSDSIEHLVYIWLKFQPWKSYYDEYESQLVKDSLSNQNSENI